VARSTYRAATSCSSDRVGIRLMMAIWQPLLCARAVTSSAAAMLHATALKVMLPLSATALMAFSCARPHVRPNGPSPAVLPPASASPAAVPPPAPLPAPGGLVWPQAAQQAPADHCHQHRHLVMSSTRHVHHTAGVCEQRVRQALLRQGWLLCNLGGRFTAS
jgi:hypothetical protein